MTTKILKSLFIFAVLSFLFSCSTMEKDSSTAEGLYKIAQEYDTAERYEVALQKYGDVKNKFPYSSLAISSELAIADVNFKRESYAEAQIAYQNFRDLHPKHPKIDYVIYRTGMSFFQQLPDSIDRDLSLATDAIYHFGEVIKNYPKSEFVSDSKEKRDKCYIMLAEKELYIANFYLQQKQFEASLVRFENLLVKYPGLGLDPKALLGATRAAAKLNNERKQKKYSELLSMKYSNSDEAKILKTEGL
ncbi:MAG: outer membrane protein assembly factor BamD [Pseudobdellovibrio sp.]